MNNCNHFRRCLQTTRMWNFVKQTSFVSLWSVCFLRQNKVAYWLQLHGVRPWGPIRDMYRNTRKRCPEVDRPLQTGSCLTSLWGFAGVQCVLVGHPLDQAGWDQLALSGSQSPCLFFFFFSLFFFLSFFKLPPLEPSWYSPALNDTESVCAEPLFVIPACETKIRAKNSSIRVTWPCRYRVFAGLPQRHIRRGGRRKVEGKKGEKKLLCHAPVVIMLVHLISSVWSVWTKWRS